jgi:hypothetical protein
MADVVSLAAYRNQAARDCRCVEDYTCFPHRLVELAERVQAARADFEQFQFCDQSTFDRLTTDVLDVLASITDECLPDERTAR